MTEPTAALPPLYAALIASERVSRITREALLRRAQPDDPDYEPAAMPGACFQTLRALVGRIIPQSGHTIIDIGQRLDAAMARGIGDGWRFAELPPDKDAYEAALTSLAEWASAAHGATFAALDTTVQDIMLTILANGQAPGGYRMAPSQLARWFEDVRADAARIYVSHPATMARIGYSGIGYGGDSQRLPGFTSLDGDSPEPWEPKS